MDDESKKVFQPKLDELATGALFAAASTGGLAREIEHQERMGQASLVNSTQLPVKGSPGHSRVAFDAERTAAEEAAWAATGIEFGPVEKGALFRDVKLPPGWRKCATDHPMWSDLVDANGRLRATIFYKGAIYDQDAHIGLVPRFFVRRNMDGVLSAQNHGHPVPMQMHVLDGQSVVWSTQLEQLEPRPTLPGERSAWWHRAGEIEDQHRARAVDWLESHYPDFRNLCAYWDEPVPTPT